MHQESLPVLFDRVGGFFIELDDLRKRWPDLTPAQRVEAVNTVFLPPGRSKLDKAISDYQTVLDTLYEASSRGCTMKVFMR